MNRPRPRTSPTRGCAADRRRPIDRAEPRRAAPTAPTADRGASPRSRPGPPRGSRRYRGTSTCACPAPSAPSPRDRPTTADKASPPPMPLPTVMRSGTTPACSAAHSRPVRPNPDWISSKMSGDAVRVAERRGGPARKPSGGMTIPPLPWTRLDRRWRPAARLPRPGPRSRSGPARAHPRRPVRARRAHAASDTRRGRAGSAPRHPDRRSSGRRPCRSRRPRRRHGRSSRPRMPGPRDGRSWSARA